MSLEVPGELGDVPTAAETFDQEDAGVHAPAQDVDLGVFILQTDALGADHFEIRHQPALSTSPAYNLDTIPWIDSRV
jgi:hypothetical protein